MTKEERWQFDLKAMEAFGFDSQDVDLALKNADFDPDKPETYSEAQAADACLKQSFRDDPGVTVA